MDCNSCGLQLPALLSPQCGILVIKEGPQNSQKCKTAALTLRETSAQFEMCSWSQRGIGGLAHPCLTPNGSSTAEGHNEWPRFHLNVAFRSSRRGLRIGKNAQCRSISGHRQRILTCVPGPREAMGGWHIPPGPLMDIQQLLATNAGPLLLPQRGFPV